MQIDKLETGHHGIAKRNGGKQQIILPTRTAAALGFQQALQALNAAYTCVATMLDDALESSDADLAQLAALGANYAGISERRRLVKAFLESEPAIDYAHDDFPHPDHIRSLAETAAELASERDTLVSALGLLNYIDLELGWADGEGRLAVG
jgi:hypothetical protein